MPSIKGIDLSDGIRILMGTGGTDLHFNAANFLANTTIAKAELAANKWLQDRLEDQVQIHIFSLVPLKVTCIVGNRFNFDGTPYVIPANWWE